MNELREYFERAGLEQLRGKNDAEGMGVYVEEMGRFIPKDRSLKVLDLGSGDGELIRLLQQERPLATFYAADFAFAQLRKARVKGTSCLQMCAPEFPLRAYSMDLVISFSFVQYLSLASYRQTMVALKHVLKPGGKIVHLSIPDLEHFWKHSNFPQSLLCKKPWWILEARYKRRFGEKSNQSFWWSEKLIRTWTPSTFSMKIEQSPECWYRMNVIADSI